MASGVVCHVGALSATTTKKMGLKYDMYSTCDSYMDRRRFNFGLVFSGQSGVVQLAGRHRARNVSVDRNLVLKPLSCDSRLVAC